MKQRKACMIGTVYATSESGMALVVTLMILALITALVVEFAYGVYTTTAALQNWKDSQRLSLIAVSGQHLAVKTLQEADRLYTYTYPGKTEMPLPGIVEDFEGMVFVKVEDENAKLNINSIILANGLLNEHSYKSFRFLLRHLGIDEDIADIVADWIDKDSKPRLSISEENAKNDYMDSIDELLLLQRINPDIYEKVLPYITVYSMTKSKLDMVNINTVSIPVIMSLDDRITEELAERIIDYREISPFEHAYDILKVAGFDDIGKPLQAKIAVKATNFRIICIAEERNIKRVIESVIQLKNGGYRITYWMET
ncbi:MAG: type II secretion system minor pseudopilin GspK [Nitrospiraceae bacterium]|nr:MAG: type II secretion system minor pseudopilin GspK [Nitrospiraceae bacterium]